MPLALAAVAAVCILAVLIPTITHLIRRARHYHRLEPISEREAREHARPLTHAITSIAPTEEPKPCQDSPPTQSPSQAT